jgi:hypothetical protein
MEIHSLIKITGTCGQDTSSPLFTPYPPFFIFFLHFHGLEICKTAIICRFHVCMNLLLMIQFYIPWVGEGGYDENLK